MSICIKHTCNGKYEIYKFVLIQFVLPIRLVSGFRISTNRDFKMYFYNIDINCHIHHDTLRSTIGGHAAHQTQGPRQHRNP